MQPHVFRPGAYSTTAITNTAAVNLPAISAGVIHARVVCSVDAWIVVDNGVSAAVGTGVFLPAGWVEYFVVHPGNTISAIADHAATGSVNLVELTR